MKKIFSLLIVIVMLCAIPLSVSANVEDGVVVDTHSRSKSLSKIGGTPGTIEEMDAETVEEKEQAVALAQEASAPVVDEYAEDGVIVVFEDEPQTDVLESMVTVEETLTVEGAAPEDESHVAVVSDDSRTTEEIVEELKQLDGVKYAFPNRVKHVAAVPNDTFFSHQWALQNIGQNAGIANMDINPENLWSKVTSTSTECVVAVMDTGIDTTHEDIKNVLWKNTYSSLPGKGNYGYDCTGTYSSGAPKDDDGHGTHVAGIIAASADNSLGISGLNRSKVKIMPLRVADCMGDIAMDSEIKAFDYIVKAKKLGVNIKAVNCSYGGFNTQDELKFYNERFDELGKLGIVTCVAAGNDSFDVNETYDDEGETLMPLPAASTSKYCLTVAAAEESGNITSFSNYGTKSVDIAAPGSSILSTVSYNNYEPVLYTAEQRKSLCKYYRTFEKWPVKSGELFYGLTKYQGASDLDIYQDNTDYFGKSGNSLALHVSSDSWYGTACSFGIPYKLSNSTGKYYISFKIKCYGSCDFAVYDTAASDSNFTGNICYYNPGYEWDTCVVEVNPSTMTDYTKGTSRELCFSIETYDSQDVWVQLDDVSISKQGAKEADFGKYAFYSGTSMATPYVAGAVALTACAYPSASAETIISAIKKSAVVTSELENWVEGGRFLDLTKVPNYMPAEGGYKVSGTVTSYLSATEPVTVQLLQGSSVKYSTSVKGNSASYSIANVASGTYTLRVSKKNHVTRDYSITVSGAKTQNVQINPLGDVTGDGNVTTLDFARANAHAKGVILLTDYALKCGDVVGNDGKITTLDAAKINAHAKGAVKLW